MFWQTVVFWMKNTKTIVLLVGMLELANVI